MRYIMLVSYVNSLFLINTNDQAKRHMILWREACATVEAMEQGR